MLSQLAYDARAVRAAPRGAQVRRRTPSPAASRISPAMPPSPCAGRCRSCAPHATRRLGRVPLQGRGPGPARARGAQSGRCREPARTHRHALQRASRAARARCCSAAASASRPWCSSPSGCSSTAPGAGSRWCSWARRCRSRSAPDPRPSSSPACPPGTIACMPLLEEWGVPSRLASRCGLPRLLPRLRHRARRRVARLTRAAPSSPRSRSSPAARRPCWRRAPHWRGATACPARCRWRSSWRARWAAAPAAPCEVRTPDGPAMKRVCVDGPVFDAYTVF